MTRRERLAVAALRPSVENWNRTFPKYPPTMDAKGWIYGVWYCGTSWQRVTLHGQYPPGFLKRALALFPEAVDIVQVPSGTVTGPGITIDAMKDAVRVPQIQAQADALPLPDESADLILSDPPYTHADSAKYGCKPFPMGGFMKEAHRILRPGGHLGMLHVYYPSYHRKDWDLIGLIAVVTGFCRATRMFSILERRVA
jgi:SAM-dependent methyltransferase